MVFILVVRPGSPAHNSRLRSEPWAEHGDGLLEHIGEYACDGELFPSPGVSRQ